MAIHKTEQPLFIFCLLLFLPSLLILNGCSTINTNANVPAQSGITGLSRHHYSPRTWRLSENAAVMIMAPILEQESQQQRRIVQQQLELALAQVFARVKSVHDTDLSTASSSDQGYHYYIVPQVLQHVNRANSLQEFVYADFAHGLGRDYLQVKLLLYNAMTAELLDTTVIEVYAKPLSLAKQPARKLFFKAFSQYAVSLSSMAQQ